MNQTRSAFRPVAMGILIFAMSLAVIPHAGPATAPVSRSTLAPAAQVVVARHGGVDLRGRFASLALAPRQQGKRGACQAFAFLGPAEFELARKGRAVRLSPQYLMWAANRANHLDRLEGFNPDLLVRGLEEYGVCEESLMPYVPRNEPLGEASVAALNDGRQRRRFLLDVIKHWTAPIGFDDSDLHQIMETLEAGTPVTATFCWPAGLNDREIVDENFFLRDRGIDGADKSGHGVVLVGYVVDADGHSGHFIFRNSWGAAFAEGGYAKISFALARKYGIDAYVVTIK